MSAEIVSDPKGLSTILAADTMVSTNSDLSVWLKAFAVAASGQLVYDFGSAVAAANAALSTAEAAE